MSRKMNKSIVIAVLAMFSWVSVNAQDGASGDRTSPGVVKINLTGFGFRSINLQGEYAFHKNLSGCFQVNYMLPGGLPGSIPESATQGLTDAGFTNLELSGYSITPEIRWYPGKKVKKQAPNGFYFAPYLRYGKYTFETDYNYIGFNVPQVAKASFSYGGFGGGLMMGSQWIIGKHFSIDWFILGGHGGSGSMEISMTDDIISTLPQSEIDNMKAELAKSDPNAKITISGNTVSVEYPVPYAGIRGGLCLGYAF